MLESFLIVLTRHTRRFVALTMLSLCLAQSGCGLIPRSGHDQPDPSPIAQPVYDTRMPVATHSDGAIFQSATSLTLFEDLKAKRIGDILIINLSESTNATKNSTTTTSKSTDANIANANIFGYAVTHKGTPLLSGSLNGEQAFSGEGGATQSNRLEGSVTVTVVDRMPNGNLVVQGEKWLTLNQGKEFVRVSGIVRPIDILADNSVSSEKVANARIEYAGKGVLADANQMNWLARFFNSPWLPF